jgi:hypothetical protein
VGNGADFEFTCRGRTLTTAYGGRIDKDRTVVPIESTHALARGIDLKARDFSWKLIAFDIRHDDFAARLVEGDTGIELLEEALAHMKLFGKQFLGTCVAQPFQLCLLAKVVRNVIDKGSRDVVIADGVADESRVSVLLD